MWVSIPMVRWTESSAAAGGAGSPRLSVSVVCGKPAGMYSSWPGVSTVSIRGSPSSESVRASAALPRASGSAAGLRDGSGGA